MTEYLDNLAESIIKLQVTLSGDNTTLSGDNTKAITDAQTSTDNLTKTVGCVVVKLHLHQVYLVS